MTTKDSITKREPADFACGLKTRRQLTAFAIGIFVGLAFIFAYWLAPIIGYTFHQQWAILGYAIAILAQAIYRATPHSRRK
jgi:hypothetical protein